MSSKQNNSKIEYLWDEFFLENMVDNVGEVIEYQYLPVKKELKANRDKKFLNDISRLWNQYLMEN